MRDEQQTVGIEDAGLLVPPDGRRRAALEKAVAEYVRRERLAPPLTAEELAEHARFAAAAEGAVAGELGYVAVLLNNCLWAEVIAGIPYERRLLLLPQCLASAEVCRAERDGLGLLCAQCGGCDIGMLQAEAERLGYVTLVAEGTTVVSKLLASGKVDAVVGVGCMDSLRRIFPVMSAHAIPGQGIPLLADGCSNTRVDLEWALGVIGTGRPGLAARAAEVDTVAGLIRDWFRKETLDKIMGKMETDTERIVRAWLLTGGKRWRPLLTASVFEVYGGEIARIREAAVAVECFHKASLVHDDIEDNDDERYGLPTVHNEHGVPAAINAGDYLIGEGYRLLAGAEFSDNVRAEMVRVAAHGHRELCLGQGEELAFCRKPAPVSEAAVLRIYERKTAAAFEVAVLLGAVAAGADAETRAQLSAFSRAAGIAYQIQDDIEDFRSVQGRAADMLSMRPTVFLATACASDHPGVRTALDAVWCGAVPDARRRLIEAISEAGLHRRVELLHAHYRNETERVLACVQHAGLNRLLRRIMGRMFKKDL